MCLAGNMGSVQNLALSIIKPLTPDWIHSAVKCIVDRPQLVINGWDKCGLLVAFKPATAATALSTAKRANHEEGHAFFPLFPTDADHAAVVCEPNPVDRELELEDGAAAGEQDLEASVQLGLAAATARQVAAAAAEAAPKKRTGLAMPDGQAMYPMFSAAAAKRTGK
jgi:hypothetical protein